MAAQASNARSSTYDISARMDTGATLDDAVQGGLDDWRAQNGKIVSGFGHRFHKPVDPRAPRLMALVRAAAQTGTVSGRYAEIGEAVQANLECAQTTGDEHRRGNGGDFLRTRLSGAIVAGPVLPVPIRRNSIPRVGANAARRAQQRPDAARVSTKIR